MLSKGFKKECVEAVRRHLDERERCIESWGLERYIEILCEEMDIFPLREGIARPEIIGLRPRRPEDGNQGQVPRPPRPRPQRAPS